jgi:hypothetical protein
MAVSKRTRFEVLRRDNHTCRYCRSKVNTLTIDHVTPVALGGTDDPSNLVACCLECNSGKASTTPDAALVDDVSDDAVRWAAAMRQAADILAEQLSDKDVYVGAFLNAWPSYRTAPDSLLSTVAHFYELGLPEAVMADAAQIAGTAKGVYDRPAYFAGMCWKRVRAMQDIAQQIVSQSDEKGPVR